MDLLWNAPEVRKFSHLDECCEERKVQLMGCHSYPKLIIRCYFSLSEAHIHLCFRHFPH